MKDHRISGGAGLVLRLTIVFIVFGPGAFACGQTYQESIGLDALLSEFGSKVANGSRVTVSQVEAQNGGGNYLPNPTNSEFLTPDKVFTDNSNLSSMISSHATTVGRVFYGNDTGTARGVINIENYEANHWINVATGFSGSQNPFPQPWAVQNHSWIGGGVSTAIATNILSRIDYMANQNNMNVVAGVNNTGVTPQLLAHGYNSISVGLSGGGSSTGLTTFYGAGRVKPEIVAPLDLTSFSTPAVSGSAAILRDAGLGSSADHNEAVKAMILAGATKTEFQAWQNTSTIPLDFTFGAGEVNIYNSYKIFLAGETDGQAAPPATSAGPLGWDFGVSPAGSTRFYSIELPEPADHFSVALTWNIQVVDSNSSPTIFVPSTNLPNLNLIVTGPNGFMKTSIGAAHNIEHVYGRNLPAGVYSIIVMADNAVATDYGLAWRAAAIQNAASESVDVVVGGKSSGTLSTIANSDDIRFAVQTDTSVGPTEESVVLEFESTMPVNMPNSIQFDLEARAGTLNLEQKIEIFDFENGQYQVFDVSEASLADSQFTAYATGELFRFFEPTKGTLRARVSWKPVGPVFHYPWTIRIDRAAWSISQ